MYTALVLICLSGNINDACYGISHPFIFETIEQCKTSVWDGVESGAFVQDDMSTNKTWKPVDYKCIDWRGIGI